MSEFTTGNLFLSGHTEHVQERMLSNSISFLLEALTNKWSALYLEDDWLNESSSITLMLTLSESVPILNFSDAEDHGWGYRVFAEGGEQARFNDDYYLDHGMVIDLAEARYPDIDVQPFLYLEEEGRRIFNLLLDEVRRSPDYQAAYAKQFENKHVEAFAPFGIDAKTIEVLDQLISPEGLRSEPPRGREVSKFKSLLGISEMEWKSYHHLMLDKSRDE